MLNPLRDHVNRIFRKDGVNHGHQSKWWKQDESEKRQAKLWFLLAFRDSGVIDFTRFLDGWLIMGATLISKSGPAVPTVIKLGF